MYVCVPVHMGYNRFIAMQSDNGIPAATRNVGKSHYLPQQAEALL
jgi:hypothetical protein